MHAENHIHNFDIFLNVQCHVGGQISHMGWANLAYILYFITKSMRFWIWSID